MAVDPSGSQFPSSQWSLIVRAGAADPDGRRALADLVRRYCYPLYVYVRRRSGSEHEAEDLTQSFLVHLLESKVVAGADRDRGRFRNYLLTCCQNYIKNVYRANRTQRNGGGVAIVSLDWTSAAARYAREPATEADPESQFRRKWALALLDETFAALEAEYQADGHHGLFVRLRSSLTGDPDGLPYREIGLAVGMNEPAVRKAAQRLRERFGQELRRRVAETVAEPAEVDAEIRDLFRALA